MSHGINFLKDDEIRYLSAAASNPLYKYGAIGAVTVIVAAVGLYYFSLKRTISEGERLQDRWNAIAKKVAEADVRNKERNRLNVGKDSLLGWQASNIDWVEVMNFIIQQYPGSLEDIQIARLEMDEVMDGLRSQAPGGEPANFYPMKRTATINIRGQIRSMRPERQLTQFQRNLLSGDAPVPITEVSLDQYTQLRSGGEFTDRTTFAFTLNLSPVEVVPPEEEEAEEKEGEG